MKTLQNNKAQGSQFLMLIVVMILMMFIFMDPNITALISTTLDSVFYPIIGFNGNYPVLTLILAGVIVVFLSSFFQNLFTDWKKTGEMQENTRAFQREITTARKAGNTNRVNKLMKMQPEIMRKQTEAQSGMMKPMILLFIFIVPIFVWLRYFLGGLPHYHFTVPWANDVSLFYKPFLMQAWLWIYMMFSMAVGHIIRLGFKWISWSDWWKNKKGKIIPSSK